MTNCIKNMVCLSLIVHRKEFQFSGEYYERKPVSKKGVKDKETLVSEEK